MEPTNNTNKFNNESNTEDQSDQFILFKPDNTQDKEEAIENSQSDVEMITDEEYLIDCARYNDFDDLKKLIAETKDLNINYQDDRQNTALRI